MVGAGLYLAVLGLLALGLATIIRHTAGAISAFVGVVLVLPLIVQALPASISNAVARYLPANIGLVMFSTHGVARPHRARVQPLGGFRPSRAVHRGDPGDRLLGPRPPRRLTLHAVAEPASSHASVVARPCLINASSIPSASGVAIGRYPSSRAGRHHTGSSVRHRCSTRTRLSTLLVCGQRQLDRDAHIAGRPLRPEVGLGRHKAGELLGIERSALSSRPAQP